MAVVGDVVWPSWCLAACCYVFKKAPATIGNGGQGVFLFKKSPLPPLAIEARMFLKKKL
jgi:hypothetical protein